MLTNDDELLHPIGSAPHWQESYYFNWTDARQEAFGLARIGFRFAARQVDGLVLTMRGGKPEFCYPAVHLRHRGPWSAETPLRGLRAKNLSLTLEQPLERWSLSLTGRNRLELTFSATTPPFSYNDHGRVAKSMAGEHFEQAGRVTGWTEFHGHRVEVNGLGQRDKSWGPRDWSTLAGWTWLTGHFGEDLSFNATQSFESPAEAEAALRGETVPCTSGFIFREGRHYALTEIRVQFQWAPGGTHRPIRTEVTLTDEGGAHHVVRGVTLGSYPLLKGGAWIEENHTRFTLTTNGGPARTGHGVVEQVWRPTARQLMKGLPRLLTANLKAMRP